MRRHLDAKWIEWVGGHELKVLLALFVVVAGTWMFIVVAGEVAEGDIQAFDERIVRAMRKVDDPSVPIGPHWLAEVGRDVTALGGYAVLVAVTLAVVGFLHLAGKPATMCFVLVSIVSGYLLGMGLKSIFERPRPDVVPHLSDVLHSSFPSGHSMMSAVVYMTLGTLLTTVVTRDRLKFYFLSLALLLTVLVGVSRVYLGVHYPTDILAGWSAGLAWSTLCYLVARWLNRHGLLNTNL